MFILPLQVEGAAVDRAPAVSISIAALCALCFVATWLLPPSHEQEIDAEFRDAIGYYQAHPYLTLPSGFTHRFLSPHFQAELGKLHAGAAGRPVDGGDTQRNAEQDYLDQVVAHLTGTLDASPMSRFALVPARGLVQPGWLTSMFLHFGWLHLLGNLLFFYLTGPLLEDLWGRRFFAAFYLLGGLAAAAAEVLGKGDSYAMIAGASGAIAACMGAFTVRFGARRVRMGYLVFLLRIFRGTFLIPAWLWGLCWFGGQVFDWRTGGASGVAVLAHIGGFVFGAAIAAATALSGFEDRVLRPAVESVTVFREKEAGLSENAQARKALTGGDRATAVRVYQNVLVGKPSDREATLGLARLELETDPERAMARVDKLARDLCAAKPEEAWLAIGAPWLRGELERLSPRTAKLLLAARASAGTAAVLVPRLEAIAARELSQRSLSAAGSLPAAPGAAARDPEAVAAEESAVAEAATGLTQESAPLRPGSRSTAPGAGRSASANSRGSTAAAPGDSAPAAAPAARPPSLALSRPGEPNGLRVVSCKLLALGLDSLTIEAATGQKREIPYAGLSGVGSAILPPPEGGLGERVITDLVLRFGDALGPTIVARIEGSQLNLPALYPGVAPAQAHRQLLAHLLELPSVRGVPEGARATDAFPRFSDAAALDAGFYLKPGV